MQRVILPPVRFGLHAPDVQAPLLLRGASVLVQCKNLQRCLLAAADRAYSRSAQRRVPTILSC